MSKIRMGGRRVPAGNAMDFTWAVVPCIGRKSNEA